METEKKPFYFPHHLFNLFYLLILVPLNILFSYFVQDWLYLSGRFSTFRPGTLSATAFIVLLVSAFLQRWLFIDRLRSYLLPEHPELFAKITTKDKETGKEILPLYPLWLCRRTLKWSETDPALDSVYQSLLQYGRSSRLLAGVGLLSMFVMRVLGFARLTG